jgi:maleate cis-trans isomerase
VTTTVGFLYPGYAAEDDYPVLEQLLGDVALPVVHTSIGRDAHTADVLRDTGSPERLAVGVREALHHPVSAVVWACTSGSFVFGWDGACEQVRQMESAAGVPCSSTSLAFARAAAALGVRRVSVGATYPADLAGYFVEFLGAAGLEVAEASSNGIFTAAEAGRLGREAVLALGRASDHPDAEAVLLPDTALHTAAWLDALEAAVGKPVLTANQVSVWEGLRLAGDGRRRPGMGELFRQAQRGGR